MGMGVGLPLLGAHVCPQCVPGHVRLGVHTYPQTLHAEGLTPACATQAGGAGGILQDLLGTSWDLAGPPELPPPNWIWCRG